MPEERFACHVSSAARSVFAILPGQARRAACSAGHGALSRTVRASSLTRPGRGTPEPTHSPRGARRQRAGEDR
ncbi:hypothetical protein HMPREF0970_01867 [Schaalia odontolytica F0309]|uniref:Uncharacterized protein n=1 Tax=Schaalia odontolytica F0309 TaxID=649742 RepID=D4U0X2_9ACTO|nr:hypothetical protein HMPREF0970_01867 [Schaalia odontolytica F0309]